MTFLRCARVLAVFAMALLPAVAWAQTGPSTRPGQLPPGHPPVGGQGMPAGHPPVNQGLPPGHPAVGQPPATQEAKVSPEAKVLMEQIGNAYMGLKSLELAGAVNTDFDVAGQKKQEKSEFTSSFASPNKFRQEVKGEEGVVLGSTGEKAYVYSPSENQYLQSDAPKEKPATSSGLPHPAGQILQMQNPSLLLAMIQDPGKELLEDAATVDRLPDVKEGGKDLAALKITPQQGKGVPMTLLVDPQTHLIQKATYDLKGLFEMRGMPDVKSAQVAVDYTAVKPDAPVKDEQFAWAPPAGAKDAAAAADAENPAKALVGKPAPDFKLENLDGKTVSLADQKGSVVVLDFWATWCGPCQASMPNLNKLYQEKQPAGLKVFAVNVQEPKDKAQGFVKSNNFTFPVLLDANGEVSQQYSVQGIPQTVVIGKDGTVKKVLVGFAPGHSEEELRKAVEAELAAK